MAADARGIAGYADKADELFKRYESIAAADVHSAVLHLMPSSPARVLDIGAGTGRDAAWFAALGHQVVAVEPTDAMRLRAMALHPSPAITWLDDSLPDLIHLRARQDRFDLVMLTAVFMHLDADERVSALPNIASQLASGGTLIMRLRHGPIPAERRMFEIPADEVTALAASLGLHTIFNETGASTDARNRAAGVTWTILAFQRAD